MTSTVNYYDKYDMTIGIECHVQLATKTKLFSPADNDARGAEPNSKIHPIDFALPGMLPRLNREAVRLAVRAGKALDAKIANNSSFDRKHYFYPDLPKGYQTTQLYHPIIGVGTINVPLEDDRTIPVRIHHAHLEEDAGKLSHEAGGSLVDLNRAGTPLIEVVSEPDMHSAKEARAYATELYYLMTYAGVTNGDLYHGNMRFDVNISIAKKGATELGTRSEIKNLNSFRSIERAAEYEFNRQAELLESGQPVVQETRGWSEATQVTTSQRSKEDAQDYRYMPDADIPPITLSDEDISGMQADMPVLPPEYREKWKSLAVDGSVVAALLAHQDQAATVSAIQDSHGDVIARRIANWFASAVVASQADTDQDTKLVAPDLADLVELAKMSQADEISSTAAKQIFNQLLVGEKGPRVIAARDNLMQLTDESEIVAVVDQVLADPASTKSVEDIRAGKDKAIGYLVGQVMKQSKGKANPALAQKIIKQRL